MMLAQREELILPEAAHLPEHRGLVTANSEEARLGARISSWLEDRTAEIRHIWATSSVTKIEEPTNDPESCADYVLDVLAHRQFNHQSRGRILHHFPVLRHRIEEKIRAKKAITFFLLLNGGYRATPLPGRLDLIFEPDQTELLLLYQISLLQRRIAAFYAPGIDFVIVVNNGVARWVNDIPIDSTDGYVGRLRMMILQLGAMDHIRVLSQSELPGYSDDWHAGDVSPKGAITDIEHRLVERFLGRKCDRPEARFRSSLYSAAESVWAETLRPLAEAQHAVMLRQVAHPDYLSFRPFPGGAIRAQNGTLGFSLQAGALVPILVTARSFERHRIMRVPVNLPVSSCSKRPMNQIAAND